MRIRMLDNFRGRLTNENLIPPGEYDADDPFLYGIAEYLVNEGWAVVIEDAPAPVVEPDTAEEPVEALEQPVFGDGEAFEEEIDPTPRRRKGK